jgi:hypothetical protein
MGKLPANGAQPNSEDRSDEARHGMLKRGSGCQRDLEESLIGGIAVARSARNQAT